MNEQRFEATPTLRVALAGEIDLLTAGAIGEAAVGAIEAAVRRVEIDLREVTFLDSQGLNALLDAQRALRREGIGMQLTGTPRRVREVLELAGVAEVFTVG